MELVEAVFGRGTGTGALHRLHHLLYYWALMDISIALNAIANIILKYSVIYIQKMDSKQL